MRTYFIEYDRLGSIFQTRFDEVMKGETKRKRRVMANEFIRTLRSLKVIAGAPGTLEFIGAGTNGAGDPGICIVLGEPNA